MKDMEATVDTNSDGETSDHLVGPKAALLQEHPSKRGLVFVVLVANVNLR